MSSFLPGALNKNLDYAELLAKVTYSVIPANPGSGLGQAPESRIVQKYWIPGRALLARNDDFL